MGWKKKGGVHRVVNTPARRKITITQADHGGGCGILDLSDHRGEKKQKNHAIVVCHYISFSKTSKPNGSTAVHHRRVTLKIDSPKRNNRVLRPLAAAAPADTASCLETDKPTLCPDPSSAPDS